MKLKKMSRPKKNYCDYFSHDRDMRNHRKIKALRLKYGIQGYALWVMFLEFLTGSDYNIFNKNDIELELLSGDFGVSVTEVSDVIDYCIRLGLLTEENGCIYSESLNERLDPVYKKREASFGKSNQQPRQGGKFAPNNTEPIGVSVTESTQSKVKEIKVNEIKNNKENFISNGTWEDEKKYFMIDEQYQMGICTRHGLKKEQVQAYLKDFLSTIELNQDYKSCKELKIHFTNWINKKITASLPKQYNQEFDPTKVKINLKADNSQEND